MNTWWYVARSSGLVAWALLLAATLWGLAMAARLVPRPGAPRWMADMHRFLGGLAVAVTGLHLVALVADSYVEFDLADLMVPFASQWRTGAVAWGVVATWGLVAVEVTSLAMKRLPRRAWRGVHLCAYLSFWAATLHGSTAGTDAVGRPWFVAVAVAVVALSAFVVARLALSPPYARAARRAARARPGEAEAGFRPARPPGVPSSP